MAIRMTGMISQMDTESLVQSMIEAQKMKNKKVTDKKTILEWQEEKWQDLNKKLYALYTEELQNLTRSTAYTTKTVTSSNTDKLDVTGDNSAANGSHVIEIDQLATSQYVTSGKVDLISNTEGKKSSKLTELGIAEGTVITVTSGDKQADLEVKEGTTIDDFLQTCRNAGLNATYDKNQGRLFISSAKSGEDGAFSMTTSTLSADAAAARRELETLLNYDNLTTANKKTVDNAFAALQKGGDTAAKAMESIMKIVEKNVSAESKAQATAFVAAGIRDDLIAEGFGSRDAAELAVEKSKKADIKKEVMKENPDFTQDEADAEISKRFEQWKTDEADAYEKAVAKASEDQINKELNRIMKTDETQARIKELTEKGVTDADIAGISADSIKYFKAEAFDTLENKTNDLKASAQTAMDAYSALGEFSATGTGALSAIGLGEIDGSEVNSAGTGDMNVVKAQNSIIKYNGVVLENASNSVVVNGLTLTLKSETKGEKISLAVSTDVESTYDAIKKFVTKYNEILQEMNDLYYAKSAKGYEPLTEDEQSAMTDKQVEMWEGKIKDSMLRRDSTIYSITTSMRNALMSSVEVNGKKYSLASFGVTTSKDYLERGLLHIKGDADDALYKSDPNKLKEALQSDPDTVMKVFQGVAQELYSTMQDKMKKTSLSSAMKFYNDKHMQKQIDNYSKRAAKDEKKLIEMENKYYKQFSAMETALAKLQSQQNALAGMLGS